MMFETIIRNAYQNKMGNFNLSQVMGLVGADIDQFLTTFKPAKPSVADVSITGRELFDFGRFYKTYFRTFLPERDFGEEFDERFIASIIGLFSAKKDFDNRTFGESFYAQMIRPVTLYAPSDSVVENFIKSSVTAGWNTKVWDINLGYSSSTSVLNLRDNVTMLIFGIADFDPSAKIIEYKYYTPTENYGVKQVYWNYLAESLGLHILEDTILLPKNTASFKFDFNYMTSGSSIPAPLGIQFVTKEYYAEE